MRKKIACVLAAVLVLILSGAWASEPAIPADRELVEKLLPGYQMKEGTIEGSIMRLLMYTPEKQLVFVGAVCDNNGQWTLTESTPLPEGTILGVENFTQSLGIPSGTYFRKNFHCVDVTPFEDGTWGVTMVYPSDGSLFQLGKDWVSPDVHPVGGAYGYSPWRNIQTIDWSTLPGSYEQAVAGLDTAAFAVVSNPNPADRLHLRTEASRQSETRGKYYNGTPVIVTQRDEEWCKVSVGGAEGYMMTEYLCFGDAMEEVEYAGPWLHTKQEETKLYSRPVEETFYRNLRSGERFYVIAVAGEEWYHVWLPDAGIAVYVLKNDLWEGNG